MEGHCSTGQTPQWAVVPMEEEAALNLQIISSFVALSSALHCNVKQCKCIKQHCGTVCHLCVLCVSISCAVCSLCYGNVD